MTLSRLGLFGGTFDPIHLGHLILAERAFEQLELDQLIFIPAKISPYKIGLPPAASAEDRMKMIQLAIAGRKKWHLDSRELFREGPSFAIDTISELRKDHPGATLFLLIGADQVAGLTGWKESEKLQKLVTFVVLSRKLENRETVQHTNLPLQTIFLDQGIDISSTEVRERLAKSKKVDYLLCHTVHDYIKTKKLYQKSD